MRHRKAKITLDRNAAQRSRLIRNLSRSLILHGRITTTVARAKAARSMTERLVTLGKKKTLASRRLMLTILPDALAVNYCIEKVSPKFSTRLGGYTRLMKLSPRQGDGAARAVIEFVS